jgi:hypothetical protein
VRNAQCYGHNPSRRNENAASNIPCTCKRGFWPAKERKSPDGHSYFELVDRATKQVCYVCGGRCKFGEKCKHPGRLMTSEKQCLEHVGEKRVESAAVANCQPAGTVLHKGQVLAKYTATGADGKPHDVFACARAQGCGKADCPDAEKAWRNKRIVLGHYARPNKPSYPFAAHKPRVRKHKKPRTGRCDRFEPLLFF